MKAKQTISAIILAASAFLVGCREDYPIVVEADSFVIRDETEMEIPLESSVGDDLELGSGAGWISWSMKDSRTVLLEFDPNDSPSGDARETYFYVTDKSANVTRRYNFLQNRSARSIMTQLYEIAGGTLWRCTENWLSDKPVHTWQGINGSDWYDGVYCENRGYAEDETRILSLDFAANNMTGDLGEIIDLLVQIEEVEAVSFWDMRVQSSFFGDTDTGLWNDIYGCLPASVGRWKNLKKLNLNYLSNVSGSIPRELFESGKMESFKAVGTCLAGPLPDNWSLCMNLQEFETTAATPERFRFMAYGGNTVTVDGVEVYVGAPYIRYWDKGKREWHMEPYTLGQPWVYSEE